MPEVIEIREYADLIRKYASHQNIIKIKIHKGRYKKHGAFDGFTKIQKQYPLSIIGVYTKGKFLYIECRGGIYITNTCGLSGGWCLRKQNLFIYPIHLDDPTYYQSIQQHLNVEFILSNQTSLFFYDMLSFGTLKILWNYQDLQTKLEKIGPDIMENSTTLSIVNQQIQLQKNQEKEIGIVLMDQKIVSGIGNYLRSEILYLCKINPFRKVKTLNTLEIRKYITSQSN